MAMIASEKKVTFECNICSTKASTKRTMERHHKIVHSGDHPFQCNLCSKRFALKFIRNNHQETHNPQFIECAVCSKDVRSMRMKNHMRNAHELKQEKKKEDCNICGKSLIKKSLNQHLKKHEQKLEKHSQIEKCPICKKQFSFQEGKDLSMHMAKHELAKKYQCEVCKKFFGHSTTLTTHKRIHTGEKPYSCLYCSMHFHDLSGKNNHERIHAQNADEKPPKNVTKPRSTRSKTCKKVERSVCKVCDKLVNLKGLNKHMKTHTSADMLACEVCERKFGDIYSMKRHISLVHLSNKPYSCEICQKSFTLKFSLKNHEELHKGLQIKCETCEKMFSTQRLLAKHDRLKHKTKVQNNTATCKICKKTLFDTDSLKRHNLLVHSKSRPFPCKSCSATFAICTLLNKHTRDKHVRRDVE